MAVSIKRAALLFAASLFFGVWFRQDVISAAFFSRFFSEQLSRKA
jgi:hypothetical protein